MTALYFCKHDSASAIESYNYKFRFQRITSPLYSLNPLASGSRSRSRSPSLVEDMDAKSRKLMNPELGQIDFTLLYDELMQKLTIHIIRCSKILLLFWLLSMFLYALLLFLLWLLFMQD